MPEPDPNNKKACEKNADNRDRPPSVGTGQKIVDTHKEYGGDQNAPKDQKPGTQASHALNLVSTTQGCLISWFELLSRPPGDRSQMVQRHGAKSPGLLLFMELSSRTAIIDGLDMMGLPDLAPRQTADLL